jgi:poly-gamma-glutamate synthesis protein (capsule biosynthesis protein)
MTTRGARWFAALTLAVAFTTAPAPAAPATPPLALRQTDVPDGFTFAAVGDLLELRPVLPLQDSGFLAVDRIVHGADVAFGNDELPIVDISAPGMYPMAENGASNIYAVPAVAKDFKAQGFAMVARANNHSTDWGVAGMLMTDEYLDAAGVMHAGTGRDEDAARRVRFVETRWGRMGLASATSTFEGNEPAGVAQGDVAGRPGASVVHTVQAIVVDRATLDGLKRYYGDPVYHIDDTVTADSITVFGQPYVVGPKPGIKYTMDKGDVASIVHALRQGNLLSNFLVFSVHCHEDASGIGNDVPQGAFLRDLAHDAIDAGADVFVGHGPHQVGGIEIYKGKPIFYSLGNYIFQLAAMENIWPEGFGQFGVDPSKGNDADVAHNFLSHYFAEPKWWQSVVATVTYRHDAVDTIKLYPIDLRRDSPVHVRGLPVPATSEEATEILKRIQRLSEPFGTKIAIENGVGVIRP